MEESLQLFCRHAFKQDHPKIGYEKLSELVIQYARCLPLALKVLGSSLYGKDTKIWESALQNLRKQDLDARIYDVLRVSYDGLEILDQEIFLDIAFFLRGGEKESIISVLDARGGFSTRCGIDSLIDKALITISRDKMVEIHDLLQEMAERIVREQSREHPKRRRRLNNSEEIKDMLKNSMGTNEIEGISLILNLHEELRLSADAFKKMTNLRILNIRNGNNIHLPDDFGLDSLYDKLIYFSWEWYPLKSLPSGFCAEKLVEIHMPSSKVLKLWDGVHNLTNLKTINLICCFRLMKLPDLSMAQKLETVHLECCRRLQSIHPSILTLPKLWHLNLLGCLKLKSLHGDNHMKSLKLLNLQGCESLKKFLLSSEEMTSLDLSDTGIKTLKLPIGRFNKLEELYIGGSLKSFQINELRCLTSLKRFSLSHFMEEIIDKSELVTLFNAWRSLEKLDLRFCAVFEIPDNINALSQLKTLSLRGCAVVSLPNSIKNLSQLKEIDLGKCTLLTSLPELPPSITQFYADGCISLKTIDFKVMRAIYNNKSCEIEVIYPGRQIPKGFKYSQMAKNSVTIELAPSSSSDHLLGFASSCTISVPNNCPGRRLSICRKFHFEDEEIYYKGEKEEFRDHMDWKGKNVYQWYDPMESILKETKRRFDKGTASKFACEFFVEDKYNTLEGKYNHWIKGCGIWPLYASNLQEEVVEEMELKLENHRRHDSIRRSKRARQSGMPYFLRTRGMLYFLRTRGQQPKKRLRKQVPSNFL